MKSNNESLKTKDNVRRLISLVEQNNGYSYGCYEKPETGRDGKRFL